MDFTKISFILLLVLASAYKSESRTFQTFQDKIQWPKSETTNDNCFCYSNPGNYLKVSEILVPYHANLERLVIYLYKDVHTNEIKLYIPNKTKQNFIPDLAFEVEDKLVTVTDLQIDDIFSIYSDELKLNIEHTHIRPIGDDSYEESMNSESASEETTIANDKLENEVGLSKEHDVHRPRKIKPAHHRGDNHNHHQLPSKKSEINLTAEDKETSEINLTVEDGKTSEINLTVEDGETSEINLTVEDGKTSEINLTVEDGETSEINLTVEDKETSETNLTAEDNETSEINSTAEDKQTSVINLTAEDKETSETNLTAEDNETSEINLTAEDKETSETNLTAEDNETSETNLTVEDNETSEINLTSENKETSEINLTAEDNETSEINLTAEDKETSEINLTAEDKKTVEINLTAEDGETSEINLTAEEKKTGEINFTVEDSETSEINLTAEDSKTSEINLTAEDGETSEINLTAEDKETGEINFTAEDSETSEINLTSEDKDSSEINLTMEGKESSEINLSGEMSGDTMSTKNSMTIEDVETITEIDGNNVKVSQEVNGHADEFDDSEEMSTETDKTVEYGKETYNGKATKKYNQIDQYQYATFDSWFRQQMLRFKNYKQHDEVVKISTIEKYVLKILRENNMHVSVEGVLTDTYGTVLDLHNLYLRPIFIGKSMDLGNFFKHEKEFVAPANSPYLQAILVSYAHPSIILGIIPLGKTFIPGSALNAFAKTYKKTWMTSGKLPSSHIHFKHSVGIKSLPELMHTKHYHYLNKGPAKMTKEHIKVTNKFARMADYSKDQKHLLMHVYDSDGNKMDDDSAGLVMKKMISAYRSGDVPSELSWTPSPLEDVDDEDIAGRIIGGNAATSSGMPLSVRGRIKDV